MVLDARDGVGRKHRCEENVGVGRWRRVDDGLARRPVTPETGRSHRREPRLRGQETEPVGDSALFSKAHRCIQRHTRAEIEPGTVAIASCVRLGSSRCASG